MRVFGQKNDDSTILKVPAASPAKKYFCCKITHEHVRKGKGGGKGGGKKIKKEKR